MHGGTVVAESAGKDKGATFTVKLPWTETVIERARPYLSMGTQADRQRYASFDALRVLVVDDEPSSNGVVSTLLASCGAEVRVAASAVEGLEELGRWTPDVIVTDIGMPKEDGYFFLRKVRASRDQVARIPAIALTAYATPDDRTRILSAGFQAHVAKPLDPAELVAAVVELRRQSVA